MIIATVCLHVAGLVAISQWLRRIGMVLHTRTRIVRATILLVVAMLCIIMLHTVEAWGWAGLYMSLGEFSELRDALYFSVATATTLGYGDLVLSEQWRLLGTFEAMGGLLLFGASTAFLIGLVRFMFEEVPVSNH